MTKKTKLAYFLLGLFVLLGLLVRLYRLDQNVPELYTDETGHYYYLNAITTHSVGLMRWVSYLFFTASWFIGLNPLGVRLMSAIFSTLIIIAGFYFAKVLEKHSDSKLYLRVALVYSFLLSVIPWNFSIGRLGHTHVPLVTFCAILHLYLYLKSQNLWQKLTSFVPFLVGSYYYPTLILMSPLVLILPARELYLESSKYKKPLLLFSALFLLIIGSILVKKYKIFDPSQRGLDLAIWRDVNVTADTNLYRGLARGTDSSLFSFYSDPELITNKIFYNYPVAVIGVFTKNYLSFFSPDFLFLKGDPVLRHSTGMVGSLYLFLLPFFIYGIYVFYSQKSPNKLLITLWILASPIPAAIAKDGAGYLLRASTLLPFLTYFCALGIVYFYENLKYIYQKLLYLLILSIVSLYSFFCYFYGYFHVYPSLAKDSFEYGFKSLSVFQQSNNGKLLIVWEDKYPYTQFCFWQQLPFEVCDTKNTNTRKNIGESRVDLPIPNLLFSLPKTSEDVELVTKTYQPRYIAVPPKYSDVFSKYLKNKKPIKQIFNPDQTVSFSIYEI